MATLALIFSVIALVGLTACAMFLWLLWRELHGAPAEAREIKREMEEALKPGTYIPWENPQTGQTEYIHEDDALARKLLDPATGDYATLLPDAPADMELVRELEAHVEARDKARLKNA